MGSDYFSVFLCQKLIDCESQDLHSDNIVWNCHDTRIFPTAHNYKELQRDFDFRLAFIDFGASIEFPKNSSSHHIPCRSLGPPEPFRSPEQDQGQRETFDLFAADVYGLGQVLIYEVSTYGLSF